MARRLRAGDVVEVKSMSEILATLDSDGSLENMPYMPEMAKFSGRRFRVEKRAHKTCNTVENTGGAQVTRTVHLEGVRCDGAAHGGCQAACLIFWREEWLKKVKGDPSPGANFDPSLPQLPKHWIQRASDEGQPDRVRYRCQITEIPRFTRRLRWWQLGQYLEDVTSGNVGLRQFVRGTAFSLFRNWAYHGRAYNLTVRLYNWIQRRRGGSSFPFVAGTLDKTPHATLDLKPGEWVRVKDFDTIVATLDSCNKNRGLGFDTGEMRMHCTKTFQIKSRVQRIINEQSGEMMNFSNPCVTLEGVYCTGETTPHRLFCPRAIPPYWREIWLERAPEPRAEMT